MKYEILSLNCITLSSYYFFMDVFELENREHYKLTNLLLCFLHNGPHNRLKNSPISRNGVTNVLFKIQWSSFKSRVVLQRSSSQSL